MTIKDIGREKVVRMCIKTFNESKKTADGLFK